MNEIWKDIKGFEGLYQISNLGRVKSLERKIRNSIIKDSVRLLPEKILKNRNRKNKNGYDSVVLAKSEIDKTHDVHRLVAIYFLDNPLNKPCVNHKNGIKTDNRVENLEWCTYSENQNHAINTGLFKDKHENNPMAKLTNKDVIEIKKLLRNGESQRKIAKIFNVHFGTISNINVGKTWIGMG